MENKKTVLGFVGSPNRDGRTHQLVTAALAGAARAGAPVERIQMADHVVSACRDCLPWVCQTSRKCSFDDPAFDSLCQKIMNCGALILGSPVYWWDTSAMVRALIQKMFRVHARSAPLQGLPALGIGIAGGTGNGLISGLRPVYHFFQMLQMRALEPLPATRFNFQAALERAGELGEKIGAMADQRAPFAGLEERLLWYDALPYLNLNLAGERRLLAAQAAAPLAEKGGTLAGLARAETLAASGRRLESLEETTAVYEAGVKSFANQ